MKSVLKNIYPIHCTDYDEGCGFFIGSRFFTSGHVIAQADNPYIEVCGERVYLTNPIYFGDNEIDANDYDLAVFDIPSCFGSFELYEYAIKSGIVLKSLSYKHLGTEFVETDVVTGEQEGNYISGISKANLKSGSSGSPVLIGNKVVGIMTKGNNNDLDEPFNPELPLNYCVFLSSTAIRNVIKI